MSIRGKLSLLTLIVFLAIALLSVSYFVTLNKLNTIEMERQKLSNTSITLNNFATIVNSMDTNQIDSVYERFQESLEENTRAFDSVETISELPKIDRKLAESIQVVLNFRSMVENVSSEIQNSFDVLIEDVQTYFHETHSTQIIMFYTNEYIRNKHDLSEVFQHLESFFTAVTGTNGTLQSINRTISDLGEMIDQQIEQQQSRAFKLFFIISSVLVAVVLFYSWIITRSINSRVRFIDSFLRPIGQGDLSDRITEKKNDEISAISASINTIVENLSNLIRHTKEKVHHIRETGEDLSAFMEQTSSSVRQINNKIASNNEELENQTKVVNETMESGEVLKNNGELLNEAVKKQISVIEESSTAIEELIANIKNFNNTVEMVDQAAVNLLSFSETGNEKMSMMVSHIQQINQSSENLSLASELISNIADQTNLLAINASIQASHAGEIGKGFAVVAGEIRSLATQSATQAERVSRDLAKTREGLQVISNLSSDTQGVFNQILGKSRNVSNLVEGLRSSIGEQNSGNTELLSGINEMRDISSDVNNAVFQMEGAIKRVFDMINVLQQANTLVNANNSEISRDTDEIAVRISTVNEKTNQNKLLINALEDETDKFHLNSDK